MTSSRVPILWLQFPPLPLVSATMAEVRWGIVGAGKISFDFCLALKTLPASEHCIKAVAARSLERSNEFAGKFGIEKAYGTYDELFQDNEIDVVYVGTLTPSHKELSMKAMIRGKHVLCEKPLTKDSKELEELLAFAESKQNIIFMEVSGNFFLACIESIALYTEISGLQNKKSSSAQYHEVCTSSV